MNKNFDIQKTKFKQSVKALYYDIYELGARIGANQLFLLAGGIAFNIFLYIIPLILILVYFINFFIEPEQLIQIIQSVLIDHLPSTDYYTDIIASVIQEVQKIANTSKVAGIIGFAILLWISSTVVSSLHACISKIFKIEQPHYFKTKLKDLGTTILLNILILVYCVFLPIVDFVGTFFDGLLPIPAFLDAYVSRLTLLATQSIISFILFYFIYWIIPTTKEKSHHWRACVATLIAVVFTELSRILFTWYISTVATYTRFYGTYAVLVTMAVWLYYSCFIILFAAELGNFLLDKRQAKSEATETETKSESETIFPLAKNINKEEE